MKAKWASLLIAFIGIVLLIGIIAHLSNKSPAYQKMTVEQGNIIEEVQAAGYITPQHSISVKSPIGGNVEQVFHDAGDYVKAGEALIAIKPNPAPIDYATAKEDVMQQQANLLAAQREMTRYQRMIKENMINQDYEDYVTAQQTYATAQAQLALAQQRLALIVTGKTVVYDEKIDNTIVAPISGYIMKRNVDVGDYVTSISSQQTATILFTISDMKDLMFSGYVDEAASSQIYKNMPATVDIGAVPGLSIKGVLSKISLQSQQAGDASNAVDQSSILTHSPFTAGFQVEVTQLQVPEGVQLRDGYSATANIAVKSALSVPIIPERLLHFEGDKPYVFIPAEKNSALLKKQPISLGISNGIDVQITNGLKVGDIVVDRPADDNN